MSLLRLFGYLLLWVLIFFFLGAAISIIFFGVNSLDWSYSYTPQAINQCMQDNPSADGNVKLQCTCIASTQEYTFNNSFTRCTALSGEIHGSTTKV